MLLYRSGAVSGLLNTPPCVADPIAGTVELTVALGAIGEYIAPPPDVAGTPGLRAPVLGAAPRLWAAASRHPSSPAPPITRAHAVLHDTDLMGDSFLSRSVEASRQYRDGVRDA